MEEHARRLSPEALLAHAGWLRQLAASLVADPGAADDVVQDTCLAALLHPPTVDRPLEPWLARVARNFAFRGRRGELRRAAHELAAGPAREAPTPAQTVERLELQRSVVEAVLAIEEPFRTTIVQRYFEGHPAAEIARRFGVPGGTVRWRLKRGLAELRARLDGRFGSREGWYALLAPLARRGAGAGPGTLSPSAASSTVLSTMLAMSALKATAVLVMVVVAGVAWWSFAARSGPPASASIAAESAPAEPAGLEARPSTEGLARMPGDARQETALETGGEPALPAGAALVAPQTAVVEVRFVDATGAPWGGVRFGAHDERRPTAEWGPPVLSLADGRARLELVFPDPRLEDPRTFSHALAFLASRGGCTTVVQRALVRLGETTHLGDVVLAKGVRLSGRVLDEQGRGIPGATIGSTAAQLPPQEDGRLARHGSKAFDLPVTRSADDGTFVLDGVGAGTWRLWGHASGTRYGWSAPLAVTAERDLLALELVLPPLLAGDRIEGRVVDPDGNPMRTELVCRVHDARHGGFTRYEQVDEQGRFSILIEHDGETWDLTVNDFSGRLATASVEGVQPGTLDVVLRMRAQRFLDVAVLDTDGQPVEGAGFFIGAGGAWTEVRPEASGPGDYRMPLPDARFRLEVFARGFRTERYRPLDPASLPSPLEVVLRRAPAVRGRVLAAGQGVAGARVMLHRDSPDALETFNGFRCVMSALADAEGSTDADGRFVLFLDLDEGFWIRATAAGLAPAELGPIDPGRLASAPDFELVLTEGGAIEGRVLTGEGIDAEGTIVAINHGDGDPRTVRAGPGGVFRFEGLAPGKWQVLASDADVDPASGSYASLHEAAPIEWSCEVIAGRTTLYDLDLRSK